MPTSGQKATTFADYLELLAALAEQGIQALIVGGHAVNFWAEQLLEEEPELKAFHPFTSEDLDLHRPGLPAHEFLMRIASRTEGERDPFGKAWTIVGRIYTIQNRQGASLLIDSLKAVSGLRPEDIQKGKLTLDWQGVRLHVLHPIVLLKAKAHNVLHIDQRYRQDEKHVRMLVPSIRGFIRRLVDSAVSTGDARPLLNALEQLLKTTSHREVTAAAETLTLDLAQTLPLSDLRGCRVAKVANFLARRLPYWHWMRRRQSEVQGI